jgi:hypothetical protein
VTSLVTGWLLASKGISEETSNFWDPLKYEFKFGNFSVTEQLGLGLEFCP